MALLDDYLKDLAPLVNLDCGSHNPAGVTRAAEIMKGYFDSIGFSSTSAPKWVTASSRGISLMPTISTFS